MTSRLIRTTSILATLFALSSCGGGSKPAPQYSIGGNVTNLAGTGGGLTIANGSGADLPISANGPFTLPGTVASGTSYAITIAQQPSNPPQTCGVQNGSGVATNTVSDILIDCSHNEFTWVNGPSMTNATGIYGTMNVSSSTNFPGARQVGATWTDSSGALWLFGGYGYDSKGNLLPLSDVWKFANGQWTWVGGPDVAGEIGVYGTKGQPSASNIPGARESALSWKDSSGAFWMFGGIGFDAQGNEAELNDLWKYADGQWTWISGSNIAKQRGVYGTKGQPNANNTPGARTTAAAFTDASGNFWLFGGEGYDGVGGRGELNDLWEYSNGQWTWISGSNVVNQSAVYGVQGTPSPANVPGGRSNMLSWTDASGNFYIYGGAGYGAAGLNAIFGDFWKFSNGQWTWIGGLQIAQPITVYGTRGVAAATNYPGWRQDSATWADASGNLWLFGGNASDMTGAAGELSDLWEYSNGEWTWMAGLNQGSKFGVYGTQGEPMPSNVPGGRSNPSTWVDSNGNLWMLGGWGSAQSGAQGDLGDLWMYKP